MITNKDKYYFPEPNNSKFYINTKYALEGKIMRFTMNFYAASLL